VLRLPVGIRQGRAVMRDEARSHSEARPAAVGRLASPSFVARGLGEV
jgi:hypothetical protein